MLFDKLLLPNIRVVDHLSIASDLPVVEPVATLVSGKTDFYTLTLGKTTHSNDGAGPMRVVHVLSHLGQSLSSQTVHEDRLHDGNPHDTGGFECRKGFENTPFYRII